MAFNEADNNIVKNKTIPGKSINVTDGFLSLKRHSRKSWMEISPKVV